MTRRDGRRRAGGTSKDTTEEERAAYLKYQTRLSPGADLVDACPFLGTRNHVGAERKARPFLFFFPSSTSTKYGTGSGNWISLKLPRDGISGK